MIDPVFHGSKIFLTKDSILDGKIIIFQPKVGYRVAVDPLILGTYVKVQKNQKILDVGCGVGVISLILKMKEPTASVFALDMDEDMYHICCRNVEENAQSITVINDDLANINANDVLKTVKFDQIVTNPPFFRTATSRITATKRRSNFETMELFEWISHCFSRLKDRGMFSIIHVAERLDDIIFALRQNKARAIEIIPIFSHCGANAKRVVVCCRKNSSSPTKITSGLIMHEASGEYSAAAAEILSGKFLLPER
ncbi:MAG: methyltransferase [Holosporaceae bacterium]|jgi:tRNA1(Val) A37 N6-methylase TrmN6|nr:methyltransferase [Holosporaceae bacterium]